MCGIAGLVRWTDAPVRVDDVVNMCRRSVAAAPTIKGSYAGDHAALGMRRLSIIDLATGHQPIRNEDGTVWVVFNGEIYNYRGAAPRSRAARPSLPTRQRHRDDRAPLRGARRRRCVRSRCAACSPSRSGTRAAAQLLLARDRLGIKPLYYAHVDGGLVVRVGAEGAPRSCPTSSAGSDWQAVAPPVHVPVDAAGAEHRRGRPQARAGASRGHQRAGPAQIAALLGPRPSGRTTNATEGELVEELRELLAEAVELPPGQRRAGRRVPQRRHRLERRRRARWPRRCPAAIKTFQHRLRGARVRRARSTRAWSHARSAPSITSSCSSPATSQMRRGPDLVSRRAVRRQLGDPDLHGVEARRRTRQGRAHRRRRRRALRRLRQVRRRGARAQSVIGWPAPLRRALGAVGAAMPDGMTGRRFLRHLALDGATRYLDAVDAVPRRRARSLFQPDVLPQPARRAIRRATRSTG